MNLASLRPSLAWPAAWGRGALDAARSFALPQRCPGCGSSASAERMLCDACRARIPCLAFALCARCLSLGREPVGCVAHPHDSVWPAWLYDEHCAAIVHAFKFGERVALAGTLADELARVVPPQPFDLVVPVPLHATRRRERGYDQAALLAGALANRIGVPLLEHGVTRVRPTAPQTLRGAAARRRNLRGAFRVNRPRWFAGRRVLVVDDVITTGATLEACLGALSDCGARPTALAVAWAQ